MKTKIYVALNTVRGTYSICFSFILYYIVIKRKMKTQSHLKNLKRISYLDFALLTIASLRRWPTVMSRQYERRPLMPEGVPAWRVTYTIPKHKGRRTRTSRPICAVSQRDAARPVPAGPRSNLKSVSESHTFIPATLNHFAFQTK